MFHKGNVLIKDNQRYTWDNTLQLNLMNPEVLSSPNPPVILCESTPAQLKCLSSKSDRAKPETTQIFFFKHYI